MTVLSAANKAVLPGNGSQTAFVFSFNAGWDGTAANLSAALANLVVVYTDPSGNQTTLSRGSGATQYQVSLNAPVGAALWGLGGTVTYDPLATPIPAGSSLTLLRTLPLTQPITLQNQASFGQYAASAERMGDLLEMELQQAAELYGRAIVVPPSDPVPLPLPAAAQRALKALTFDASGNPTAGVLPASGVISSAMAPVVSAATTALGRTALGIPPTTPYITPESVVPPAVGDGVTNDTAAMTAFFAACAGLVGVMRPGAIYLTDPQVISQTNANVPAEIVGNFATLKARAASASPLLTLENTNQGGIFEFKMSDVILDANNLHGYPLKIHGGQHMTLFDIIGKNGATGGIWLSGEPGFGIYSSRLIGLFARGNAGSGFIVKSINNAGLSYVNGNAMIGWCSQTSAAYGFDIDYASVQLQGGDIENNAAGGFNVDHCFQCDVLSCHIEANNSPAVAFATTANTNFLRVIGGITIGTITASALSNVKNEFQTSDSNTLISWKNGVQTTAGGLQLATGQGIGMGVGPLGANSINVQSAGLGLCVNSITKATLIAGLQLGVPTGGDTGTGTLNVSSGIFLNNTAYTNPDYVLEHFFTGRIRRFANRRGAARYRGLMPLPRLKAHMRRWLRLPGITGKPADIFTRSDIALEKIEELTLHVIVLNERIKELEGLSRTAGKGTRGSRRPRARRGGS